MIFFVTCLIYLSVTGNCYAEDFGVVGQVWEIKEQDPVEAIKAKLFAMDKNGELDEHNRQIKAKVSEKIKHPKSLNIPNATETREYYFDPSVEVTEDITDYHGKLIHIAGTKINPLDQVTLSYELLFFDGSNKDQLAWALNYHAEQTIKPKLILTGGSPIDLEDKEKLDFYFDQDGSLITKLGIKALPAVVSQSGKLLLIKEVLVDCSKRSQR